MRWGYHGCYYDGDEPSWVSKRKAVVLGSALSGQGLRRVDQIKTGKLRRTALPNAE